QKYKIAKSKRQLNALTKETKKIIHEYRNKEVEKYLLNFSRGEDTNYSLWKTAKRIKRTIIPTPAIKKLDNTWAKTSLEQAMTFVEHLRQTFQPVSNYNKQ
ncbi:RNA-directed DNA polymerase from mobile element jockey, partial [Melipona quadrifasciata]